MVSKQKSVLCLIILQTISLSANFKGVMSSIESFPPFTTKFWKGLAQGFGMPPAGYDYTFSVINDSDATMYVATEKFISLMGGALPQADSFSAVAVEPWTHHTTNKMPYYFEMYIQTTPDNSGIYMPYVSHAHVVYQQECLELDSKPHSTKHHYYRIYTGKKIESGQLVYAPAAEYLGYTNLGKKDASAMPIPNTVLTSFNVKNSTNNNYYLGWSNKIVNQTTSASVPVVAKTGASTQLVADSTQNVSDIQLAMADCAIVSLISADSYALLSSFGTIKSFAPGSIGIFDATTKQNVASIPMPSLIFANMTYTLEIYQAPGQTAVSVGWQGVTPGTFDMPKNNIKDITPISCFFWNQSAAQQGKNAASFVNLPGSVWIISIDQQQSKILATASAGNAVSFSIDRPQPGDKKYMYFIYVDETDATKAQAFLQKILQGSIGKNVVTQYQDSAQQLMQHAAITLDQHVQVTQAKAAAPQISAEELNLALQGSVSLNQGEIVDTQTNMTGYLLGSDIFLSFGIGSTPMYYTLYPVQKTTATVLLPTTAVTNLYTMGQTTAPKGMPTPIASAL